VVKTELYTLQFLQKNNRNIKKLYEECVQLLSYYDKYEQKVLHIIEGIENIRSSQKVLNILHNVRVNRRNNKNNIKLLKCMKRYGYNSDKLTALIEGFEVETHSCYKKSHDNLKEVLQDV